MEEKRTGLLIESSPEIIVKNEDDTLRVRTRITARDDAGRTVKLVLDLGFFDISDEGQEAIDLRDVIDNSLRLRHLSVETEPPAGPGTTYDLYGGDEPKSLYAIPIGEVPNWLREMAEGLSRGLDQVYQDESPAAPPEMLPDVELHTADDGSLYPVPVYAERMAPIRAKEQAQVISSRLGGLKGRVQDALDQERWDAAAERFYKIEQVITGELIPFRQECEEQGWDVALHTLDKIRETIDQFNRGVLESLGTTGAVAEGFWRKLLELRGSVPPAPPPPDVETVVQDRVLQALQEYREATGDEPVFRRYMSHNRANALTICRPDRFMLIDADMSAVDERGRAWYVVTPDATEWLREHYPMGVPLTALHADGRVFATVVD